MESDHSRFMPRQSAGEEKIEENTIEERVETLDGTQPETSVAAQPLPIPEVPRHSSPEHAVADNILPPAYGTVASTVYTLLSPLMVPTYVALFIFLLSILSIIVPGAATSYALTVFGATCIVPLIVIFFLMRIGVVKSLDMLSRRERVLPYLVQFLAFGGVTLFLLFKGANPWIWTIYCGAAATTLVNMAVNIRMRISNHCSATAAAVAALIVINTYGVPQHSLFWWMVGTVFFTGVAGTLAIIKGRHTVWEVISGYVTGFLGVILFSLIH